MQGKTRKTDTIIQRRKKGKMKDLRNERVQKKRQTRVYRRKGREERQKKKDDA